MFSIFTKNLDSMEKATNTKRPKKSSLEGIEKIKDKDLESIFGGRKSKKRGLFSGWFGSSPCEGEIPQ